MLDKRQSTLSPISSGLPMRPTGSAAKNSCSFIPSLSTIRATIVVLIRPGQTQLTRLFFWANSSAEVLVADDTMLRRIVCGELGNADQSRTRCCIDDRAASNVEHLRDLIPNTKPDAFEVDRHNPIEHLFRIISGIGHLALNALSERVTGVSTRKPRAPSSRRFMRPG